MLQLLYVLYIHGKYEYKYVVLLAREFPFSKSSYVSLY